MVDFIEALAIAASKDHGLKNVGNHEGLLNVDSIAPRYDPINQAADNGRTHLTWNCGQCDSNPVTLTLGNPEEPRLIDYAKGALGDDRTSFDNPGESCIESI